MQNLFLFQQFTNQLSEKVNRLIKIGVLKKMNNSQCVTPTLSHLRKMVK